MNVQAKVSNLVEIETAKLAAALQKVEAYGKWANGKTAIFQKNAERIKAILKSHGFEFNELGFVGNHSDSMQKLNLEDAYFKIDITLRMIGRRKTFAHMGYTASGSSKQKKHEELSRKIVDELTDTCPEMHFSLNQFSLLANQYQETTQSDHVLFSMFVN